MAGLGRHTVDHHGILISMLGMKLEQSSTQRIVIRSGTDSLHLLNHFYNPAFILSWDNGNLYQRSQLLSQATMLHHASIAVQHKFRTLLQSCGSLSQCAFCQVMSHKRRIQAPAN